MLDICKNCKHLKDNNRFMRGEGMKTLSGNYCDKYHWNVKNMTRLPGDCYE